MSTRRPILVVADVSSEQQTILSTVQKATGQCRVVSAPNVESALQSIILEDFEAVFCSLSAGEAATVDFLSEVWARKPKVPRFAIGTTISAETKMRCAFGGHHFLELPLNCKEVVAALERTDATKRILPNERIQLMISRVRQFPSAPTIYFEVLRELRSPSASAMRTAELIAKDLGLTTKLLQLANSPFYGVAQPIDDLYQAVLLLGLETTASIVLSLEVMSRFGKVTPSYLPIDRIWAHSLQVAEMSKKIAEICTDDSVDWVNAYLGGLMHDVGKLALAQNYPGEYKQVFTASGEEQRPLFELEYEFFGVTHAEAGAYLMALWGLPTAAVDAVSGHHAPSDSFTEAFAPTVALNVAERMASGVETVEGLLLQYPEAAGLRRHSEALCSIFGTDNVEEKSKRLSKWEPSQLFPSPAPALAATSVG